MTTYKTEEEQVEALKQWWEKNGKLVIIAGIVVVAGVVGTRAWQNFEVTKLAKLSAQYDLMLQEIDAGRVESAEQRGADIVKSSTESQYAVLASLAMAKLAIDKNDSDLAFKHLNWALENSDSEKLKHIIRLRLAKVLMNQGKLDQALTYATYPNRGEFASQYAILRGDVHRKMGNVKDAKIAYEEAINDSNLNGQLKNFVQIKIDDLGLEESGEKI